MDDKSDPVKWKRTMEMVSEILFERRPLLSIFDFFFSLAEGFKKKNRNLFERFFPLSINLFFFYFLFHLLIHTLDSFKI